ncbi:piggyBac transposable element-derived protein 3-like [Myzus persicae]|uniref:piggyBac transposable element-derived protein 3-like n=1 Tax=Myzus persicae TaxID=13164 RepID=UPI000B932637|nr:piggyBac transposable element-derived protein 3-like [Myzus persicae]
MSCKLTNEQLLDMMDGMNSDLELSDEEDDENIDDIGIANELVESVYGTVDGEEDDEDDVDVFTPDQLLPIQTPPTDEVSMPNIVTHTNTPPVLKQFATFAKSSIKWLCKPMKQKNIILRSVEQTEFPNTISSPISYFMKYFTEEAFNEMAMYTNIYEEQKITNQWVQTTSAEMKVFVGIHLMMGVLNLPRVRMYWQKEFRIDIIANNMTRNRFFELRTHFHVMNNEEIPQTNTDKFIKVRPLYNHMKNRFYQLPIEQNISIDEQMVPFKGKLAPKQYMRGKPHPWGIKFFLMCGSSGTVYDFIMFQGSSTELDPVVQNLFGQGGAVVMQFIERLERNRHYVYFDNYFTSYNLLSVLADRYIYAAGTVRVNRFAKPPLITDKCLSKMGRGTSYEVSGIAEGQKSQIGLCSVLAIDSGRSPLSAAQDKKNNELSSRSVKRPVISLGTAATDALSIANLKCVR